MQEEKPAGSLKPCQCWLFCVKSASGIPQFAITAVKLSQISLVAVRSCLARLAGIQGSGWRSGASSSRDPVIVGDAGYPFSLITIRRWRYDRGHTISLSLEARFEVALPC